jgi:N6-L-threonylcarbamoyladenine synthase
MIQSKDFNFSFSGLKTAVLYAVRDRVKDRIPATLTEHESIALAGEFESAVIDVIVSKTKKALMAYGAKSLIIGGGVISNTEIRASFEKLADELGIALFLPPTELATDNATMIGLVAVLQYHGHIEGLLPYTPAFNAVSAQGNLQL